MGRIIDYRGDVLEEHNGFHNSSKNVILGMYSKLWLSTTKFKKNLGFSPELGERAENLRIFKISLICSQAHDFLMVKIIKYQKNNSRNFLKIHISY